MQKITRRYLMKTFTRPLRYGIVSMIFSVAFTYVSFVVLGRPVNADLVLAVASTGFFSAFYTTLYALRKKRR